MNGTRTRLNPDLPLCWEDAHTLRVGFEHAVARIHQPSAGVQRLIGALGSGIDITRLAAAARRAGATPQEASSLLEILGETLIDAPATCPDKLAEPPMRARLCDDGRPVPQFRESLYASGVCKLDEASPGSSKPDLVILIERYLEPLERAHKWLVDGIPQLLVRFTDRAIHVGPIVRTEGSPCHTCVALTLVARDEALPALAAQLYGKRPQSEAASGQHMAAAFAAYFIRSWMAQDSAAHATRAVIPVSEGRVVGVPTFEPVDQHPQCACATLMPLSRPQK